MDRAQEAEENYIIKRELAAVKQQELHLSIELENQKEKVQELIQVESTPWKFRVFPPCCLLPLSAQQHVHILIVK